MNPYYLLLLAIMFEVFGITCMKLSRGLSRLPPSVMIFLFYGISFYFFTLALKGLDVSIAYAIWAGLGTALITVVGILVQRASKRSEMASSFIVVVEVIGLNLIAKIS